MEISGKLVTVFPQQQGQSSRGNWVKQEFLIETAEQFPKKVLVSAWADKVQDLAGYAPGAMLTLDVNLESREYNGRWYTDVRVWRFRSQNAGGSRGRDGGEIPPPSEIPPESEADERVPF
ncbi:MAG: DUF3127 domain-containing protein [Bacteroidales bacterium]